MKDEEFKNRVKSLLFLPKETEWVEFKLNQSDPQEIGEYISALSNSAALHHEINGYIVWGIENRTRNIIGTYKKKLREHPEKERLLWPFWA